MRLRLYILFLLGALLMACDLIHEFPENEVDPTEVTAHLLIECVDPLDPADAILAKSSTYDEEVPEKYDRRYTIEVYDITGSEQKYVKTYVLTRESSDASVLDAELTLQTKKYRFAIWMDYVLKGTENDLYYETVNSLSFVHVPDVEDYIAGTDYKDGQAYVAEADFTSYYGQWYVDVKVNAQLVRQMAKITILTTDIAEYASKINEQDYSEVAANLRTMIYYNGYFPTGYNVLKDGLNDTETGYRFNFYPYYPFTTVKVQNKTAIGSDYVFVNGESSSLNLSIAIKEKSGKLVNTVSNITVPIYKGKETIIMDKFLTEQYHPGIGIDPEFDGEYDIIIN